MRVGKYQNSGNGVLNAGNRSMQSELLKDASCN